MKHLKEYCRETTLHGFSYLADSRRSKIEKIVWIIMLIISSICTFLLLNKLMENVQTNPTVIYRPDVSTQITQIPFPAVTFCSVLRAPDKMDNYSHILDLVRKIDEIDFEDRIKVIAFNLWALLTTSDDSYYNASIQIPQSELYYAVGANTQFFMHGNWMDTFDVNLTPYATKLGRCLTFNIEKSYKLFNVKRRGNQFLYGPRFQAYQLKMDRPLINIDRFKLLHTRNKDLGLEMEVFEGLNVFYSIQPNYNFAINVMIHNPYELPDERFHYYTLSVNESFLFYVKPQLKTIDDSLNGFTPQERNCYLPHEKKLEVYNVYTAKNCKRECLWKFVQAKCGCAPFYYIQDNATRVCELKERPCFDLFEAEFYEKLEAKCDCLPSCEYLDFEVETRKTHFVTDTFIDRNLWYNLGKLKASFIVRFKEPDFYPLIRRKHFTEIDIMSFVGGLLGLFLGFSVLSFIEIIYHFSTRLAFKIYEKKKFNSRLFRVSTKLNLKQLEPMFPFISKARKVFVNYLQESSVHGFAHIADGRKHFVERLIWILTFILSMIGCVFMISGLYHKLGINSLLIALSDAQQSVSSLQFPAVTLFGTYEEDSINFHHYFIKKYGTNITALALSENETIMFRKFHLKHILNNDLDYAFLYPVNYNFSGYQHLIVPTLKNFSKVEWLEEQQGQWTEKYQVPLAHILTSRGFAFSFNIMNSNDIFRTDQVSKDFQYERNLFLNGASEIYKSEFPWNATKNRNDALKLTMKCAGESNLLFYQAFAIHSANEAPLMMEKQDLIEYDGGKMLQVMITPNVITTDKDIKSLALEDRLCFLDDEKYLRFFKAYTIKNCMTECFSNLSSEVCGCVPFDVVRDSEMLVCEVFDYECVEELQHELKFVKNSEKLKTCNCLQSCNTISYDYEIIENLLKGKDSLEATLTIIFKDQDFTPLRRFRQFTFIDFLSYVGGLLGLFAGISVLSFVEIVYFLVPRFLADIFKNDNRIHIG